MTIQDNTIIQPIPTDELLAEKERKWRLVLPADYRNFVVNYNGGIPNEKSFECNKHNYAVTRFLAETRKPSRGSPNRLMDSLSFQSGWAMIPTL